MRPDSLGQLALWEPYEMVVNLADLEEGYTLMLMCLKFSTMRCVAEQLY